PTRFCFRLAGGAPALQLLASMRLPNTMHLGAVILAGLSILLSSCSDRKNAVSGTIEVDEAHVGPRMAGRVEKIFAQEGDRLKEGQIIAQLEASELRARRDLAAAQIDTAIRDTDAAGAQLEFLRSDAKRQKDLLARNIFGSASTFRSPGSVTLRLAIESASASIRFRAKIFRASLNR